MRTEWFMNNKTGIINHFCGGPRINKITGRPLKEHEEQDPMQYGFQPTDEYIDDVEEIIGQRCRLCREVCTKVEDITVLGA